MTLLDVAKRAAALLALVYVLWHAVPALWSSGPTGLIVGVGVLVLMFR